MHQELLRPHGLRICSGRVRLENIISQLDALGFKLDSKGIIYVFFRRLDAGIWHGSRSVY
jgi:hypothetical protein